MAHKEGAKTLPAAVKIPSRRLGTEAHRAQLISPFEYMPQRVDRLLWGMLISILKFGIGSPAGARRSPPAGSNVAHT